MTEEKNATTDASATSQKEELPVATVTIADAVTTNDDNIIVANVNGKYKRFHKIEHVPAGCRTYTSKAELKGQLKKQLESVYGYVKGCEPKSFKDHDTPVDSVW